jgi:hypothetical protein
MKATARSRRRIRSLSLPAVERDGGVATLTPALGLRRPTFHSVSTFAGEDRRWLFAMVIVAAVEFAWWGIAWQSDIAPAPRLATYVAVAFGTLAAAIGLRRAIGLRPSAAAWPNVVIGALLVGIAASGFLPLKFAIPREIPFWLDAPLERAELAIFGTQPWLALDQVLGWAAIPMDWLYGAWLPTQLLILFLVMLSAPSPAKSRLLIAYSLAWFMLGVVAAVLLASAGPIFYDRLFGGTTFAALRQTLQSRGAWVALAESDQMWASLSGKAPGAIAGISAMPSIHVAISVWVYLAARTLAPRATIPALIYALLIWIGSVQLGWHYVSDGLAGAIGMIAIWQLARLGFPRHA